MQYPFTCSPGETWVFDCGLFVRPKSSEQTFKYCLRHSITDCNGIGQFSFNPSFLLSNFSAISYNYFLSEHSMRSY